MLSLFLVGTLLQSLAGAPVDDGALARLEADWNAAHLRGDAAVNRPGNLGGRVL